MTTLIKPRTLKGFRDFLPEVMLPREAIMETARRVYRRYGFSPIDTPALEYLEILTGKGSEETDRQLYRFEDHGGRQVGLRFDLTVPLARFAAQHINQLGTPFKRYHLGPVWRGENTQSGRYREFMQCDFDTIGTESIVADIETALIIHELLVEIGITEFKLRINNRQILNGLLQKLGLAEHTSPVLRSMDKLEKAGPDRVIEELISSVGLSRTQGEQIVALAGIRGGTSQVLSQLGRETSGNEVAEAGIVRLEEMVRALQSCGIPESRYELDVSIARGLDYYTGVVFETTLLEMPAIGSVCSGGRYDNLAELYTKQHLPGIGASLGLDRLLAALQSLGMIDQIRTSAPVFVAYFDKDRLTDYLKISGLVRAAGLGTTLYPEPRKLPAQLKYADARGFRVALIAGSRELDAGTVQVKNLESQESQELRWRDDSTSLISHLHEILG